MNSSFEFQYPWLLGLLALLPLYAFLRGQFGAALRRSGLPPETLLETAPQPAALAP